MKLQVVRQIFSAEGIAGGLFLEGAWECHTIENREHAIAEGTYPVLLEYSPRFGRLLPEIKNVPGRSEIKFHAANFPHELEGCIGVGRVRMQDGVMESGLALNQLMAKMIRARNERQKFTIEITHAEEEVA